MGKLEGSFKNESPTPIPKSIKHYKDHNENEKKLGLVILS